MHAKLLGFLLILLTFNLEARGLLLDLNKNPWLTGFVVYRAKGISIESENEDIPGLLSGF